MKKSEMEAHAASYDAAMERVRQAERAGLYRQAVATALEACHHADGMMRHQQKHGNEEFDCVSAIDFVLRTAPLLLDKDSIDAVENLLNTTRRIAKVTSTDEKQDIAAARSLMWKCHRLWHHLESKPDFLQSELRATLGGDQDEWRRIAEAWSRMGLLNREPRSNSYLLTITTHMDEVTSGRCPACGEVAHAPKAMFLQAARCPACGQVEAFVILSAEVAGSAQ